MSTVINPNVGGGGGGGGSPHTEIDFNLAIGSGAETNLLDLISAGKIFILKDIDLKSDNPGVDAITIKLYKNINGVLTQVDSTVIDSTNFSDTQSIMDTFARDDVVSAHIKVTAQTSANNYNVIGSASYSEET